MIRPTLCITAAISQNGVIGRNNQLPWHLPSDLKLFKSTTFLKPLIMGRRTFESIGRVLPDRLNVILTRRLDFVVPEAVVSSRIECAEAVARGQCLKTGSDEVHIIGGQELFQAFMPVVTRLYITRVLARVEGDVFFPEINGTHWQCIERREIEKTPKDSHKMRFEIYQRVSGFKNQALGRA